MLLHSSAATFYSTLKICTYSLVQNIEFDPTDIKKINEGIFYTPSHGLFGHKGKKLLRIYRTLFTIWLILARLKLLDAERQALC
jgi:hypothetical protein